jgi:hypothetical protein
VLDITHVVVADIDEVRGVLTCLGFEPVEEVLVTIMPSLAAGL